jgi:hypothetical protein
VSDVWLHRRRARAVELQHEVADAPARGLLKGSLTDEEQTMAQALECAGLVMSTPVGFTLTPRGRRRHAELLAADEIDREQLADAYERFMELNSSVKANCARWQAQSPGRPVGGKSGIVALGALALSWPEEDPRVRRVRAWR